MDIHLHSVYSVGPPEAITTMQSDIDPDKVGHSGKIVLNIMFAIVLARHAHTYMVTHSRTIAYGSIHICCT